MPDQASLRTIVLVDGEHYPPVVRAAIGELRAAGHDVVGAVLLGGTEKLGAGEVPDYGVPDLFAETDQVAGVLKALDALGPDVVVDVSGSPVVDSRQRLLLAAQTLARGVAYQGADFRFDPPHRPRVATKPSVAVVGTAKRSGKTAVAGHLARHLTGRGRSPVVVAMGRGGPEEPEVIDLGHDLTPAGLLALAESGRHAASDHLEDALMARVPTIGTRRAGGGMAGGTVSSTFARGVELANARPEQIMVLEGSGAAVPPVHADANVCAVPAGADPELVTGYLGPFMLLLADLVVVTLTEQPLVQAAQALEDRIRELVPGTPLVRTTFRPFPLEPISGRKVFFATTAPGWVAQILAAHLESEHQARVVGWSSNLANRALLTEDLQAAHGAEVLVTELKAAAVDVATKAALDAQMDVVYCDNRLTLGPGVGDTVGDTVIDDQLDAVIALASERFDAGDTGNPGTA